MVALYKSSTRVDVPANTPAVLQEIRVPEHSALMAGWPAEGTTATIEGTAAVPASSAAPSLEEEQTTVSFVPDYLPAGPKPGNVVVANVLEGGIYEDEEIKLPPRPEPPPVRPDTWNLSEYEALAVSATELADPLTLLPDGAVTIPPAPLSLEEVLAANRPLRPIDYAEADDAVKPGPLEPGQIEIESAQYIDFDEERNMVYATGRPVARFGAYVIKADKIMVDTRLREIQAEGDVILTSEDQHIEAKAVSVNANNNEGVAYEAKGRSGSFYFMGDPMCGNGTTTFRQLSKEESYFKDASFTTCNFGVPHFRVRAKEFSVFNNDRIFARNVVVYVHEVPVLWLPYFTRSMKEGTPWGGSIGNDGQLGMFVRVFYDYRASCYVPSDVDPDTMIRSSYGYARTRVDYFSKRGMGEGLTYAYSFAQGKHRGNLDVYNLNDKERDVGDDSGSRYYVNWWHRTRVTDELEWLADVDYPSDPDLFYDVFDRIRGGGERRRDRIPERRVSTALEWTTENFFAGIQVELKDRIGRDRVSYFADPKDNDYNYDRGYNNETQIRVTPPGMLGGMAVGYDGYYTDPASIQDSDLEDGISTNRYGRVTERLPQITVSSNQLRLGTLPWWYHMDLNVINNLDKGLNIVGTDDDAFVRGFDLYQSLTNQIKIGERCTLVTKFGLGVGVMEREDDSFNFDLPTGATFPFVMNGQKIDDDIIGLTLLDRDTFLVGRKTFSLKDVNPAFAYGDIDSKFNTRISNALSHYIRWRFREGTNDSLGQFYENIGALKTRDDLYNFRNSENWIESGLVYNLIYPRLTANVSLGHNLQGEGDITPNELRQYINAGAGWTNDRNTLGLNGGVGLQERQLRDPTDPNEFQQNSLTYYLSGRYTPVHKRFYASTSAYFIQNKNSDPLGGSPDEGNLDSRNDSNIDFTVGKKLGTKYAMEVASRYRTNLSTNSDGDSKGQFTDTYVRLRRDFHDVIGTLSVGLNDTGLSKDDESNDSSYQVRFDVQFKKPGQKGLPPYVRTTDLYSRSKLGAFETGG
ncbi:hypothetical protein CVU37_02395 [candidate division BRC1 bacterium HGW-BRC1-1]|jgi:hypothetical protein|nr:MAG: hypothetical protein CVU37_02395 [candidate division BRC1 bacterium HGW-BRC1-1]